MQNNPGVSINQRAENHFKLTSFFLRRQVRRSRPLIAADIRLNNIRRVRELVVLREFESTYKVSTKAPMINAEEDWPKIMESIEEYVRSYLGEMKIPLAYVICESEEVLAAEGEAAYPTVQHEMIARAPHLTIVAGNRVPDPTYLVNRKKVWGIISKITREHSCWACVKPLQCTWDGRMAFVNLYLHFLGPNNWTTWQLSLKTS